MSSPDFKKVISAFSKDGRVSVGDGKGFGSGGLKVDGKLFALIDSGGRFVAKLPKQRVTELLAQGKGDAWDAGRGRVMREWIALRANIDWVAVAREARRFVGGT
ncbi:MAG TPA: hypothetical protein VGV88_06085 [Candidatus Dormibacteraeota bacterium]|nr:hypothetical protein [Candidatus Dormibacteraeota bacterium]